MTKQWFIRKGILFLPVTFIGWLISLIAVVYCIYAFIAIDSKSHSASDTLRNFFFIVLIVAVIYSGIAYFANKVKE